MDQPSSGDEYNDDTFGEESFTGLDSEFNISSSMTTNFDFQKFNPLELDPAVASLRHSRDIIAIDEDLSSLDECPPGILAPSVDLASKKKVLTVDQLEANLHQTSLLPSSGPHKWLNPRSGKSSTGITITFPDVEPDHPPMSRYEREGIARIHLGQLTTEHPDIEDFYYKSYASRAASRRSKSNTSGESAPLYLPLPTPRRHHTKDKEKDPKKINEALASTLGKKSVSSSKRPRQQLAIPTTVQSLLESSSKSSLSSSAHYSINYSIEKIYKTVFVLEDSVGLGLDSSDGNNDSHTGLEISAATAPSTLQEYRREAIHVLDNELLLNMTFDELSLDEALLLRFLQLMASSKTKRILSRAIRAIDSNDLSERILIRLVDFFEYLDVCRLDAPETDINLFVNPLLASLVPYVSKCDWNQLLVPLHALMAKSAFLWIICSKAGLVLLCILLSRAEILKGEHASEAMHLFESLSDQLTDHLCEIFANLHGVDSEFYGWQLMALLALNVDGDRKRAIVLELRERILIVANSGDQRAIANLNIFLNALGLDASQLSANSS